MKYIVLCNRHESIYGDSWGLFWGHRESKSGYTSDLRLAHRFKEDEIKDFTDDSDIPLPIDKLGISEDYEPEETFNSNLRVLIEKGTLNQIYNLKLKPLDKTVKCHYCNEEMEEVMLCPNCDIVTTREE